MSASPLFDLLRRDDIDRFPGGLVIGEGLPLDEGKGAAILRGLIDVDHTIDNHKVRVIVLLVLKQKSLGSERERKRESASETQRKIKRS